MVVHASNSSIQEAEEGESLWVEGTLDCIVSQGYIVRPYIKKLKNKKNLKGKMTRAEMIQMHYLT